MNHETTARKVPDLGWYDAPAVYGFGMLEHSATRPSVKDEWDVRVIKFRAKKHVQSDERIDSQNINMEFRRLADEWKRSTFFVSSTQEKCMHPAYQQIIGLGPKALPLILDDLRASGGLWFWALEMISRENPVPDENLGNYDLMKSAWLNWAASRNL